MAAQPPAVTPANAPQTLKAQSMPQIRKIRAISPKVITVPRPGVFLVDFGENMAGWTTLTIPGTIAHAFTSQRHCW